jgi:hypothetical protein
MSTAGWIFSVLWTVSIIALVAVAVLWLVSALGERRDRRAASRASAHEILDLVLVSGEREPTIEQYQQLNEALGDAQPHTNSKQHPRRPAVAHG